MAGLKKQKKIDILSKLNNQKIRLKNNFSDIDTNDIYRCKVETKFNREVVIDGCKGVIDYSDQTITINVDKGIVTVDGVNLTLYSLEEGYVIIRGTICNISFRE